MVAIFSFNFQRVMRIFRSSVDDMQFRETFGMTTCRMDMQWTKELAIVNSALGTQIRKVLVTEDENSTLRSQEGQFILSSFVERRQLDPLDDRTKLGTEMVKFDS